MQARPDDRRCAIGRWKWRLCRRRRYFALGSFRTFSSAVIFQRSGRLSRTQWRFRSLLMNPTSFGPFNARLAPRSHLERSKPTRRSSRTRHRGGVTLPQMKSCAAGTKPVHRPKLISRASTLSRFRVYRNPATILIKLRWPCVRQSRLSPGQNSNKEAGHMKRSTLVSSVAACFCLGLSTPAARG